MSPSGAWWRRAPHPLLVCLAGALLVASRKPDAFLASQFWAEDGVVWYKQAYEMGWASLLQPQNGYFQTVSKIVGNLAQAVPLPEAPLVFALAALLFKLLPLYLLHTARGLDLVPGHACRLGMSVLYVAHPYSWEVFVNVTNIHWHLALSALLVVCFRAWPTPWQKASDVAIVLLCGLSGPFALFLAPIAAWHGWQSRSRRALVLAGLLAAAAAVQLAALALTGEATRSPAPLDASVERLVRIVGGQVAAAAVLGDAWRDVFETRAWQATQIAPLAGVVILGLATFRAVRSGSRPLRSLVAFGALLFCAALLQPQISSTTAQWPLFERPDTGGRYAFIPTLAFYACLLQVVLSDRQAWARRGAQAVLAVTLLVGIPLSWRVRPYEDVGFAERAAAFERAAPGERMAIPVNPRGWSFDLRKR